MTGYPLRLCRRPIAGSSTQSSCSCRPTVRCTVAGDEVERPKPDPAALPHCRWPPSASTPPPASCWRTHRPEPPRATPPVPTSSPCPTSQMCRPPNGARSDRRSPGCPCPSWPGLRASQSHLRLCVGPPRRSCPSGPPSEAQRVPPPDQGRQEPASVQIHRDLAAERRGVAPRTVGRRAGVVVTRDDESDAVPFGGRCARTAGCSSGRCTPRPVEDGDAHLRRLGAPDKRSELTSGLPTPSLFGMPVTAVGQETRRSPAPHAPSSQKLSCARRHPRPAGQPAPACPARSPRCRSRAARPARYYGRHCGR